MPFKRLVISVRRLLTQHLWLGKAKAALSN
jgi:hypothetical protein